MPSPKTITLMYVNMSVRLSGIGIPNGALHLDLFTCEKDPPGSSWLVWSTNKSGELDCWMTESHYDVSPEASLKLCFFYNKDRPFQCQSVRPA